MTDPQPLPLSDPHHVPPVFVNELVGIGILNGVVNLTFATFQFTPKGGNEKPEVDRTISVRLRCDLVCLEQIVADLQKFIASQSNGEKVN